MAGARARALPVGLALRVAHLRRPPSVPRGAPGGGAGPVRHLALQAAGPARGASLPAGGRVARPLDADDAAAHTGRDDRRRAVGASQPRTARSLRASLAAVRVLRARLRRGTAKAR